MSRKTILLSLLAVSQQTQASPPSFNSETSICKLCKKRWANSVPVQQLFCHWSAIGSLSTLWSSQEFIFSLCLDFLKLILLSLSCTAETFPTLLWWRKNLVSLFICKVLSDSKSSSEDKTKILPPQCTNVFFRGTCEASCITGAPLSKRLWKTEVRSKQHYSAEETRKKSFSASASRLSKHMDKVFPPNSAGKLPKPHGSLHCALSKSCQHRGLCGVLQWGFALQSHITVLPSTLCSSGWLHTSPCFLKGLEA